MLHAENMERLKINYTTTEEEKQIDMLVLIKHGYYQQGTSQLIMTHLNVFGINILH